MGREIHVITWYEINEIKKELDNISAPSDKLDYLMKAKLEKKKYSVSAKVLQIGEQSQAELNDLIEYWKYKVKIEPIKKYKNVEKVETYESMKEFAKGFLIKNKKKYYTEKPGVMIEKGFANYKKKYPNTNNKKDAFRTEYYKASQELLSTKIL